MIGHSPYWIEHQLRLDEVAGNRRTLDGTGKQGRDGKPEQASPLGRTRDKGMVDEFHQPLASGFVVPPPLLDEAGGDAGIRDNLMTSWRARLE